MADHAFDGTSEPEGTGLLPATAAPRTVIAPVVLRSGFGRPPQMNALDPIALLKSFRRRWALALGLGVLSAALIGVAAWLIVPPPQYSSKSILRVLVHPPKVIFPSTEMIADYKTFQKTQTELIKSRIVLGPALRNPKVMELPVVKAQADPQEWLEKVVQVDFSNGSELLQISMSGKNPDELAPIVDAVVSSYMDTIVEEEHHRRVAHLETLRKLMSDYQASLRDKRQSMKQLSSVIGTEDRLTIVMKQQFAIEDMHVLEQELHLIESDLRRFTNHKEIIEKQGVESGQQTQTSPPVAASGRDTNLAMSSGAAIDTRVEADTQVRTLRAAYNAAQAKVKRMRGLIRDPIDPALNAARSALQTAQERLLEQRGLLREQLIHTLNSPGSGPPSEGEALTSGPKKSNLETFNERLEFLKRNEKDTIRDLERYRQEIAKLNTLTIDLQTEQDEYSTADTTAKKVAYEVETLNVELQAPRRITVAALADPPRKKDSTKQYMMCGGASFGGFALAILAVSFWEMKSMRIGSVDEVVNHLGLALVGTLPALPRRGGKLAKTDDQRWQGLLVESIDATRTMLLHASRVNATRAVMITSAMKGEGKTSLAAHLATSLARAGRKTLLIDCDLRRPTLHQLFDVARVPGICELLRGEAEVNDVIRPTPADDLNLMPAGHCDGLALQSIAQDGFRDVLAILKKRYDFIIIDSAPVLPVVDTMLLSQQVDAVLFSIMRDVSRVPLVHAAHERLTSLGVRMLGAVVSAIDHRDSMHSYDYEYQTSSST